MSSRPTTVVLAFGLGLVDSATALVASTRHLAAAVERPGDRVLGLPHDAGVLFLAGRLLVGVLVAILAVQVWRGARGARVVQTVWSGLTVLSGARNVVGADDLAAAVGPAAVITFAASVAVVVLLWLPASASWFRRRSVRPAGPGLQARTPGPRGPDGAA